MSADTDLGPLLDQASARISELIEQVNRVSRERDEYREAAELGEALLGHVDALMPDIEKVISAKWKRGDYFNGPQFGATVEAFRDAITAGAGTAETT